MVIRRRSLLLAGVAVPVAARGQCVTDTPAVDACRGGVRVTTPPGVTLDLSFGGPTLDPRLTFTRASTATYFDSSGVMQTAATNAPRFDYDAVTHAALGLLIEEARTNVLLNTATLGTQSVAVTAQAYTLSFYGTGTVTKSGTAVGALVGSGAFPSRVSQTFTPTAGTLTLTVTGSVLNAQLEAGAFVTSYIPVSGVAVTRSIDLCYIPVVNMGWFTPPGGTWFAENVINYSPTTNAQVIGSFNTGTLLPLYIDATPKLSQWDTTAQVSSANTMTVGAVTRAATTYTPSVGNACLNGGAVASGAMTGGYANLATGGGVSFHTPITTGSAQNIGSGYLRRIRYWPRVLSNAELQSVTR